MRLSKTTATRCVITPHSRTSWAAHGPRCDSRLAVLNRPSESSAFVGLLHVTANHVLEATGPEDMLEGDGGEGHLSNARHGVSSQTVLCANHSGKQRTWV